MSANNRYRQLDDKVFSLASNLFGYGNTEAKKNVEEKIATQNATLLQPEFIENRIMAVYPAIVESAFAETMDNYRKYIAAYNFKTTEENDQIEKHNAAVRKLRTENQLTDVQSEFSRLFIINNRNLRPRQYNDKVNEFCKEYGTIVTKSKIQTVKYATEIVFQNLLHLYNSQLMKRNEQYMKLGVSSPRPIQEFKINSYLVTELKRNGIQSLDLCTKTVRNHRQRLEEAGVFVDYHFAGQNRPVEVHINTEILTVLDIKKSKLKTAENQTFTLRFENVLPDNNESTRTVLNEYQKNENVNSSQDIRSSSEALTPSYLFFTGTHTSNEQNSTEAAAAESVKVSKTLSEKLQDLIIHPQELAVNLSNHEYNNYKPIDIRYLYKEAYSGTLTNDEFRELAIQDFFKTISKIWKLSTPFAGSWKKAINLYYQNKWIAFTGNSFNKSALVEDIQQMRWRTEWARKWYVKNQHFNVLFPYDYFDMTRKTSKEVGFEYTKNKWNEHLLSIAKYDALKKKQEANAVRRKETINHAKKCENELNRFFKNKITMPQLFDYVEKNLPGEFLEKLPAMIERKSLKANERNELLNSDDFVKYDLFEL